MLLINLLAWRAENNLYQKKFIKIMILLSLTCMCISSWLTHRWLSGQINFLEIINVSLKEKIQKVERPVWITGAMGKALSADTLRNIANYREATRNLFVELGTMPMSRVCFTQIVRNKQNINFSGNAHSLADLTQFLQTWRGVYLFSEIKIGQLQSQAQLIHFNFLAFENSLSIDHDTV